MLPLLARQTGRAGPGLKCCKRSCTIRGRPAWSCDQRLSWTRSLQSDARTALPQFSFGQLTEPDVMPTDADVGDLVEFVTPEGPEVGVVTYSPAGGQFDAATVHNGVKPVQLKDVRLRLRPLKPIQEQHQQQQRSLDLAEFVAKAQRQASKLGPYVVAAHAWLSLQHKARAVDFTELAYLALSSKTSSDSFYPVNWREYRFSAVQILAVYFAIQRTPRFFRLGRTPFFATPETTLDAVQRVAHVLSNEDLRREGRALGAVQAVADSQPALGGTARTVVATLRHYAITGEPELAEAASVVCAAAKRRLKTKNTSDDLRNKALSLASAAQPGRNPFLVVGSLAWPSSQPSLLTDGLGLEGKHDFCLPQVTAMQGKLPLTRWPAVAVSDDLALGLEADLVPERWVVSITLPLPPCPLPSCPSRTALASSRAKSMAVDGAKLHYIPLELRALAALRPDVARPCLQISAVLRPWDAQWDPDQISVRLVQTRATEYGQTGSVGGGAAWRFAKLERVLEQLAGNRAKQIEGSSPPSSAFDSAYVTAAKPIASPMLNPAHAAEARLLAGQWLGSWAARNYIPMPYLRDSGRGNGELFTAIPGRHVGIAAATAYVPVGYPFDSAVAGHALRNAVRALDSSNTIYPTLEPSEPLPPASVLAASAGVDAIAAAANRHAKLAKLPALLGRLHFFPCELLEPANPGTRAVAWCTTLKLEAQVQANATRLHAGDRVMCTQIVELDLARNVLVFEA